MVLTFYVGAAAVEFKQYAAYMQRRTATRALRELAARFDDVASPSQGTYVEHPTRR
jgi:hypothetical protein